MKPKTKLQHKVFELSKKLRPITEKQLQWGYAKCLDNFALRSRKRLYCLECGHDWAEEVPMLTDIDNGCQCPQCSKDLKLIGKGYNGKPVESAYYGIITTVADMQVIRIFMLRKHMSKNQLPEIYCHEVMRHFVSQDGKITTMSIAVNGMSLMYDQWIYGSEMEIRTLTKYGYKTQQRHDIQPYAFYPVRKVLPIIKRNGFNGNFYSFSAQSFFSHLLKPGRFETLLKAGQIALMKHYAIGDMYAEAIEKHWDSVKIAIRNRYTVTDAGDWIDYLNLLKHFGKDLRSQKYVCPADLKKEHDRYVRKKQEHDKRIKLEKQRKEIEQLEPVYLEQKKPFLGLEFSDDVITVQPLKSVMDFFEEGQVMGHCVFTNEYFKKPESLIMSAKVDGIPAETIELSLESMKIIQARGKANKPTEYHDEIIKLVERNIPKINRIIKQQHHERTAI